MLFRSRARRFLVGFDVSPPFEKSCTSAVVVLFNDRLEYVLVGRDVEDIMGGKEAAKRPM